MTSGLELALLALALALRPHPGFSPLKESGRCCCRLEVRCGPRVRLKQAHDGLEVVNLCLAEIPDPLLVVSAHRQAIKALHPGGSVAKPDEVGHQVIRHLNLLKDVTQSHHRRDALGFSQAARQMAVAHWMRLQPDARSVGLLDEGGAHGRSRFLASLLEACLANLGDHAECGVREHERPYCNKELCADAYPVHCCRPLVAATVSCLAMDRSESSRLHVKVGSVRFPTAASTGRLVEFIGDWRTLSEVASRLDPGPVYVEVESWEVVAVNDEIRIDLGREAMAERAAFLQSALRRERAP